MRSLLALLLLSPLAAATDIVVSPGGSVQAAIAAAADGDRVLVQPGTYAEQLDFLGKAIEVLGTGGPAVTILDGSDLAGSVVVLDQGEGPDSVLQGFTVRGGTGTFLAEANGVIGGGICCLAAAPTLRDLVVEGNRAADSGGGIALFGAAGAQALVEGCTVRDNKLTSTFQSSRGGGLSSWATEVLVRDCLFEGNATRGTGGGLSFGGADAMLLRCTLVDNHADNTGGGLDAQAVNGCQLVVRDCLLRGNQAGAPGVASISSGGAMAVFSGSDPGSLLVAGTVIRGNVADIGPGIYYSLFGVTPPAGAVLTVDHCTFWGNELLSPFLSGVGLHVSTLLDAGENTGVVVRNSVFWGLGDPDGHAITPFPVPPFLDALPDVQSCDVQNGWSGGGAANFTAEPLFANPSEDDFHLLEGSPCIGAGTATATAPAADFDGQAPVGAPDVGADEFALLLYTTGVAAAGETVHVKIVGPPGPGPTLCFVGAAPLDPPLVTAKGTFGVDTLFLFVLPGLPANGLIDVAAVVPPGVPTGVAAWMQAWTGGALTAVTALVFE